MIETKYLVGKSPEIDGVHFVHAETCQVLPDLEMDELGIFDECAPAVEKAQKTYDLVNACALCCSDCYVKSGDD